MPAELFRVVEGPLERDGVVIVPPGWWGVLSMSRVPDPEDTTTPLDPGTLRAVRRTEQEADRVASEFLFGPAGTPVPADAMDSLPDGDPVWDLDGPPDEDWEPLPDDDEEGDGGDTEIDAG